MSQGRSVEDMLREREILNRPSKLSRLDKIHKSPDYELQSRNIFNHSVANNNSDDEKKTICFKSLTSNIPEMDSNQADQANDLDVGNSNRMLQIQSDLQAKREEFLNEQVMRFASQLNSSESTPSNSENQIKICHSIKTIDNYLKLSGQQTSGKNDSTKVLEIQNKQNVIANDKALQVGKNNAPEGANKLDKINLNGSKPQHNLEQAIKYSSDIKMMQLKLQGPSSNDWYQELTRGR